MTQLKIKKAVSSAILPTYQKEKDSGFDLSVCFQDSDTPGIFYKDLEDENKNIIKTLCCLLFPGDFKLFSTGLIFEIPDGYEIQIRPRSGLACKSGITVINSPGTIDCGFRNIAKVGLINLSDHSFLITDGMRIAQGVLCPVIQADIIEVKKIFNNTERGLEGFGSTGR